MGAGALALGLLLALVQSVLTDFAVPTMYMRGAAALEACGIFWRQLLRPNWVTFLLYYLLKIALGMAAALIILLGTCLTCCLAALPYVSAVVWLSITVFFRSYPLFLLRQFGDEWDVGVVRLQGPPEPEGALPP